MADTRHNLGITTTMDDVAGRKLKRLGQTGKKAGGSIAGGFIKAQLALGAMKLAIRGAFRAIKALTLSVGEDVDKIAKLARQIGVNVEALSELGRAAEFSGGTLEDVGTAIRFLQRNMGNAKDALATQVRAFEKLGLAGEDVSRLMKMDVAEAFTEVGNRIAALPTHALRTQVAMDLLGRSATKLLPLFEGGAGGVAVMREEVRRLGGTVTVQQARMAEAFQDSRLRLTIVVDAFKRKVAETLLPVLTKLFNRIATFMAENRKLWAKWAKDVATALIDVVLAVADLVKHVGQVIVLMKSGRRAADEFWNSMERGIKLVEKARREVQGLEFRGAEEEHRDFLDRHPGEPDVITGTRSFLTRFKFGDEEAGRVKGGIRQFVQDVREATSPEALGLTSANMLSDAWGNFFNTIVTGAASAGEAFKAMAVSILQDIARIANQRLFAELFAQLIPGTGAAAKPAAAGAGAGAGVVNQTNLVVMGAGNAAASVASSFETSPEFRALARNSRGLFG